MDAISYLKLTNFWSTTWKISCK